MPEVSLVERKTQRDAILGLLVSARGGWVELPEIMRLAAQYNARLWELRRLGFKIENRIRDVGGIRHSWFRLVPSEQAKAIRPEPRNSTARPGALAQGLLLDWHRDD
jgi:hypothetical protein